MIALFPKTQIILKLWISDTFKEEGMIEIRNSEFGIRNLGENFSEKNFYLLKIGAAINCCLSLCCGCIVGKNSENSSKDRLRSW